MKKDVALAKKIVTEDVTDQLAEFSYSDGHRFTFVMLTHEKNIGIGMSECSPYDVYNDQVGYDEAWDRAFVSFARDYKRTYKREASRFRQAFEKFRLALAKAAQI